MALYSMDDPTDALVKVTPPQTNDCEIEVGKGAYCFVIDVSGRWAFSDRAPFFFSHPRRPFSSSLLAVPPAA